MLVKAKRGRKPKNKEATVTEHLDYSSIQVDINFDESDSDLRLDHFRCNDWFFFREAHFNNKYTLIHTPTLCLISFGIDDKAAYSLKYALKRQEPTSSKTVQELKAELNKRSELGKMIKNTLYYIRWQYPEATLSESIKKYNLN